MAQPDSLAVVTELEHNDSQLANKPLWPCRNNDTPQSSDYLHINAAGDVDPCVFIHYSNANIHEVSLLDALKSPIFQAYRKGQPFNDNMLRPCPMLENPECLPKMVKETGAHSTDPQSPEDVQHLCDKCKPYAEAWTKMADKLWDERLEAKK